MTAGEFLGDIISILNGARVRYMIAGSFASSFHAEPRTTNDLDLVVELDRERLSELLAAIDRNRFYVSDDAAFEAVDDRSSFNVIDVRAGWKADLIARRDRRFSTVEFERRVPVRLYGHDAFVASAEDTVLSKLEWGLRGGSVRQVQDAASILLVQRGLNVSYLEAWAAELGVVHLLERARRLAGIDRSDPDAGDVDQ